MLPKRMGRGRGPSLGTSPSKEVDKTGIIGGTASEDNCIYGCICVGYWYRMRFPCETIIHILIPPEQLSYSHFHPIRGLSKMVLFQGSYG